jgi:hypothetical protein
MTFSLAFWSALSRLTYTSLIFAFAAISGGAHAAPNCLTLEQFGGRADGVTDNASAWSAALSTIGQQNACIQLGPGIYRTSAAVNISLSPSSAQAISIFGMGPRTTTLYFSNATDGLTIWMNSISNGLNLSGMTISTGQFGGRTGINIVSPCFGTGPGVGNFGSGPQRLIDNIDLRGFDSLSSGDGLGNHFWATGLQIVNASFFNIRSVTIRGQRNISAPWGGGGTGILITGSGANCPALIYNITGADIERHQYGIVYGNAVQGVTVSQSNFVLNVADISCPSTSSNLEQLTVASSQFNPIWSSIVIDCPLNNVLISGNLFFANGAVNSMLLGGSSSRYVISANSFVQPDKTPTANGVNVNGTAQAGIISGNMFFGLSTGVILGAGSRNFSVQSNIYPSTLNKIGNIGAGNVIGGGTP